MGKSFYTIQKDSVFAAGSNNFSTLISAAPTTYGLTAGQASNYASLNGTFQTALVAATNPLTRNKTTVQTKNDAKTPLKVSASNLAKLIEGNTAVTDTQKLALGLSVRATPTPLPPLGKPSDFECAIDLATGAFELKWKNTNPQGATGVVYQIWRQIGATGTLEYLGGVGGKKYTDDAVPAGSSQVTYKIQAVRSTSVGPFAQFVVNIGSGGSTTVTETTPVKLAA